MTHAKERIAVIGTGVIGRSWAMLFARTGAEVRLFDARPGAADETQRGIVAALPGDAGANEARIKACSTLGDALDGAHYAQESIREDPSEKRVILGEMGAVSGDDCILASSCSAIMPADFIEGLPAERRTLIAHPFNPPHLIPLVEIVPSVGTDPDIVERAREVLRSIGQHPVTLQKPVTGYVGNRLQAALVNESIRLAAEGAMSMADIDATVSIGLARRWCLMGPFETMDLNADGGIGEYLGKYRGAYAEIIGTLCVTEPWETEWIERLDALRRSAVPFDQLSQRRDWRDRALAKLAQYLTEEV